MIMTILTARVRLFGRRAKRLERLLPLTLLILIRLIVLCFIAICSGACPLRGCNRVLPRHLRLMTRFDHRGAVFFGGGGGPLLRRKLLVQLLAGHYHKFMLGHGLYLSIDRHLLSQ